MLNQKRYIFILSILTAGSILTNSVLASELSTEDYLCSIFPPNCPKVKKSTDLKPKRLTLSTELGEKDKNVIDRQITFEFARAYITWGPTLTGNPQGRIKIVAALPDLLPHTLWKQQSINKVKSENKSLKEIGKLEFEMHRNWLPITLQSYSQKYNVCSKGKCFNSNVALDRNSRLQWNRKLLKEDADFKYYVGSGVTHEWKSYKAVLIPKKMNADLHFVMTCDINVSTTYNWCKARSMFDQNISLGYWFEVKHLNDIYELDKNIRRFVSKSIISDTRAK